MTNYGKAKLCAVAAAGGQRHLYYSNIGQDTLTKLGVDVITGVAGLKVGDSYQANSPLPARAVLREATGGTNSSFVAPEKIAGLRNGDDLKAIIRGKYRTQYHAPNDNAKVVSCWVLVQQVKYAWNMPKDLYTKISDSLETLGIKLVTGADLPDLRWGASAPCPGRATLIKSGEGGFDKHTTFIAEDKEGGNLGNWKLSQPHLTVAGLLFNGAAGEQSQSGGNG